MEGITKRFGALVANDAVDLEVEEGTIHAIVGENGAGKTTLMRVLYCLYRADEGRVFVNDVEQTFRSPQEALAAGIGMVSQHYAIIPELTCLDNLMLGHEGKWLLDRKGAESRAEELAKQLGFAFDWNREAAELTPASCQKLEILKLLWRKAKVMILDEPTAMLSPEDGDALFENLRKLATDGHTIILVTHRLSEVLENCKRVTVMRAGKKVANALVTQTDSRMLAELIVGEKLSDPEQSQSTPGETVLEVRDLNVSGDRKDAAVRSATFDVRAGEIVGIAGVDGSGQRELVQALMGLRNSSGRIALSGSSLASSAPASERIAMGMALITEDRREEGVILDWPLQENALLGLQRSSFVSNKGVIDASKSKQVGTAVLNRFQTKSEGLSYPMTSLSGGNQQRFVAGRSLYGNPKALIAFQPTRGLDIRGTQDVYAAIRAECEKGMGALIINFDLDDLLKYCDRILVMYSGVINEPPSHLAKDRHAIGRMMVGLNA
jgi:simple sugar transport system ATP-binding protein